MMALIMCKHPPLPECVYNAGPLSVMLAQHCTSILAMLRLRWNMLLAGDVELTLLAYFNINARLVNM